MKVFFQKGLDKMLAAACRRGPYRFKIKRWDRLSDLDLALDVMGVDSFQTEIEPTPLPYDSVKTFLLIAPHQDDETIGAGGMLLKAARAGARIHVLYLTDGSQRLPGCSVKESAEVRRAEAAEACRKLGAEIHELGLANLEPRPCLADLRRIAELFAEIAPDVLLVPWVLDAPAKHRLVGHLLWLAHRQFWLPKTLETWGYQVHNTLPPDGYVDITDVAEEKHEILKLFASQNSFVQAYDHIAMGMTAWNSRLLPWTRDMRPRHAEMFSTMRLSDHLDLVERFYFRNLKATYRGHAEVLAGIRSLHHEVTGRAV